MNWFKRIGAAIGQQAAEDYCASDKFKQTVEDMTFEAVYGELRKRFAADPARLAIIEANYQARKLRHHKGPREGAGEAVVRASTNPTREPEQ